MRLTLLALLVGVSATANAQSLADRVSATRNGAVTFEFTAREGVCGDGASYIKYGSSYHGYFSTSSRRARCDGGPVQVRLSLIDGDVDRIETWVGNPRARDAKDLGAVPAREAARYLLDIAARANSGASAKAILPAVLADSATVWPTLLTIARDNGRSRSTRQDASFWLSRFAAAATSGHPNEPFDDDSEDRDDLKAHAVFVLSQLPNHEGTPTLLELARKNPNAHVRSQALFWLGQSGDPRAVDLFESILR